ncbi:hypothetical protein RRG08_031217 [Elysia crispata]|uniref:Uncharacterized protein n=1 Tax=Elysia crispata TaxID=231223 RepID=A0AAE1CIZ5_9GAST|nr:hypothetical protein RRG08_031217 [Elysia crispata]
MQPPPSSISSLPQSLLIKNRAAREQQTRQVLSSRLKFQACPLARIPALSQEFFLSPGALKSTTNPAKHRGECLVAL